MNMFQTDEEIEGFPTENEEDTIDSSEFIPQKTTNKTDNFIKHKITPECFGIKHSSRCTGPQDFDLLKVLGKGGYGKVLLVRKRTFPYQDRIFAMKILKKAVIFKSTKDVLHTKAERNILENIKHPFIVELFFAFQTNKKLYLIMEYLSGGELFMQLERNGSLPEIISKFYISEVILALEHLHKCGIVYRDLKPENIMLTEVGHIKLTDFGLSKEDVHSDDQKTHTFCGTIEYMAPEVLTRQGHGFTADWWSLGTVLYDMLSGAPPFTHENRQKVIQMILRGKVAYQHCFSTEAKDLLKRLLRKTPENRLGYGFKGVDRIKSHIFFKTVDWDQLLQLNVTPPYKPLIKGEEDVRMFDRRFTNMPVVDSPCETISESKVNAFNGFTYTGPGASITSSCLNNQDFPIKPFNTPDFFAVFGEEQIPKEKLNSTRKF